MSAALGTYAARRVRCWPGVLVLLLASNAAAQEDKAPALVDYNAADPDRTPIDYARGVANVALVNWTLWQMAWFSDKDWVPVTHASLQENFERGFAFDQDELRTNFFGHPYHGGLLFNSGRAAGLSFWESVPYALLGSLAWELFGEREQPSVNDMIATTLGGTMLGEMTHRLSSEMLDDTRSGAPRLFSELGALAVSPMRGFNRLYTGQAWRDGPAPFRSALKVELDLGVDRVTAVAQDGELEPGLPAPLIAVDVDYGDLLPAQGRAAFPPFDFFELYAAANLFNNEVRGTHVYATGLLYGVSDDLTSDTGQLRDNNVFGVSMSYEYLGVNFATFGGVGIGPADYIVVRLGRQKLRLGTGIDWVPLLGATSPVADVVRGYNFSTGLAMWGSLKLSMGRAGELGLRTRHCLATVIEGEEGEELVGSMRLWYEVDLVPNVGLGVAPELMYRRGIYRDRDDYSVQQLSTQLYLTVY